MKKIFAILGAALALAACNKEKDVPAFVPDDDQTIVVDITIDRADAFEDADTRATVKKTWDEGDVVYLFFSNIPAPKYMEMKYHRGAWTASPKNGLTASNLSGAPNKNLTALFLPYANDATVVADSHGDFTFSDVTYNGIYYFGFADYTFDGELRAALELEPPMVQDEGKRHVHFDVSGYQVGHTYSLYMDNVLAITHPMAIAGNGVSITSTRQIGGAFAGHIDKERGVLSFSGVLAEDAVGKQIDYQFSIIDETASVMYTRDAGNHTISRNSAIGLGNLGDASKWTATEFVYLGIDNEKGEKLCWAKKNLGASVEKGEGSYGKYYAFLKTTGYAPSGTFWNYTMSHEFTEETYNADPDGDPANYELKGLWRMPTEAEYQALSDNADRSLTDSNTMDVNGGLTLTGKKAGYTDKALFFPAAGLATEVIQSAGLCGEYWTSDLVTSYGRVFYKLFYFDFQGTVGASSYSIPSIGLPVRPVFAVPSLDAGFSGNVDNSNKIQEHEYVDMGYGMKWATMNIGASGPSDYGDYFAWGETAPKLTYTLSTYFDPDYQTYHYQSGPTLGRPVRLKREDDAAHVLWGDDWRMPTFEEVSMLADKNKFTWTADHSAGEYVVTSKQTGKSLRFPYSGFMSDSENYGIGTWGGIWASSHMSSSSDFGSILYYADHDSRGGVLNSRYRYLGFPIRPIRVNKVNGHEYIDLGNGLGWALENLGVDDRHPTGRADTFAEGDPATAKWGAPWRTPTQAEWQWVLNTDNCYREKSADYETAGLWFINQESRSGRSLLIDRAIFLPNTNEGYFLYWTSSRDANGNLLYISVTDEYIKYIKSQDTKYQFVRPVFSLSELKE